MTKVQIVRLQGRFCKLDGHFVCIIYVFQLQNVIVNDEIYIQLHDYNTNITSRFSVGKGGVEKHRGGM